MERRCLLHEGILDSSQDEVYCLAGFTYAQQIVEQVSKAKGKKTFEEMVPEYYRDFAKVFSEEESQRLPEHQCYALTGRSSRREVSLSGVGSGLSALATCDADMW